MPAGSTTVSIAARLNRLPMSKAHRGIVLICGLGYFFEVFDIMLASVLSAVLGKQFGLSSNELSWTVAAGFIGMFVGSLVVGRVSDRIGRRFGFFFNLLAYSVFTLLGAFSPDAAWLIACRVLAGIGLGSTYPLLDTYLNDMLPARVRGRYMMWSLTIGMVAYPVSALLSWALVPTNAFSISGWRWLFVIGSLGAVVCWVLQRNLIESPRWLESVGRRAEAEEITSRLEAEARAEHGEQLPVPLEEAPVLVSKQPWSLLFSPAIRRRTIMMYIADFLQSVGFYGFGTITALVLVDKGYTITSSLLYTFITFLGYPLGSWLTVYIGDKWERKWLLCVTAVLMAGVGIGYAYSDSAALIVILGFVYAFISEQFANAIHMYQAEIFPTAARATGAGSAYSLSRLSQAALPLVLLPVLHSSGAVAVFSIVGACMIILMLDIAILGPRTAGIAVERIGRDADSAPGARLAPAAQPRPQGDTGR